MAAPQAKMSPSTRVRLYLGLGPAPPDPWEERVAALEARVAALEQGRPRP